MFGSNGVSVADANLRVLQGDAVAGSVSVLIDGVRRRQQQLGVFGVSESASAEFSFCAPSAPPSTHAFKPYQDLASDIEI